MDGGSLEEDEIEFDSSVEDVQALYDWQCEVSRFTARFITDPKDRLPAIAALAEEYAEWLDAKPHQYMAGLWRQGMPFMLLWHVEAGHGEETCPDLPPDEKPSPTWSWHLARGRVCWPELLPAEFSDPVLTPSTST